MIISNNIKQFSNLLQTCTKFEKNCIINNYQTVNDFIKQSKWPKGQTLFDLV